MREKLVVESLRGIAENTLSQWIGVITNTPEEKSAAAQLISQSVFAALTAHAGRIAIDLLQEELKLRTPAIAERLFMEWLQNNEVTLVPPTREVAEAIDHAIYYVSDDSSAIASAAARKRVAVYRLHAQGISVAQVAKRMKVSVDSVREILGAAEIERAKLKERLSMYDDLDVSDGTGNA